jgi:hypothetical protein
MGEARLFLVVADLLIARLALGATAAAADKGHRHPVAASPVLDVCTHGLHHARQLVAGHIGRWMSGSCPDQPCQSLRQMPVA